MRPVGLGHRLLQQLGGAADRRERALDLVGQRLHVVGDVVAAGERVAGAAAVLREGFGDRWIYRHDEHMAAARTTAEESASLAQVMARKLNAATGPVALFVALRGFSPLSVPGAEFHDAAADAALVESLRALVDPARVELHEVECDINDPGQSRAMAERMHELIAG